MNTATKLTGEELVWSLMKFCKGVRANEIEIYTVKDGKHQETTLMQFEGDTKSEKIRTLASTMDLDCYDDIDIILSNSHSYNY